MSERRKPYDSGGDFVLEYGEIRSSFNRRDFHERIAMAIKQLEVIFPDHELTDEEIEDIENLVVNGEVGDDPLSELGEHIEAIIFSDQQKNVPQDESLVHWLRRIVFRESWLDQRLLEGEVDVIFDEDIKDFVKVFTDSKEPVFLRTPSWSSEVYNPKH